MADDLPRVCSQIITETRDEMSLDFKERFQKIRINILDIPSTIELEKHLLFQYAFRIQ